MDALTTELAAIISDHPTLFRWTCWTAAAWIFLKGLSDFMVSREKERIRATRTADEERRHEELKAALRAKLDKDHAAASDYLARWRAREQTPIRPATRRDDVSYQDRLMLHAMRLEQGQTCPADCPAEDHR